MKYIAITFGAMLLLLVSCKTEHEIVHKVEPIHITIDINVLVKNELKKEFSQEEKMKKSISDKEAEEELRKYLEEN